MTYTNFMQEQALAILHALKTGVFSPPDGEKLICGRFDAGLHQHLMQSDFDVPYAKDVSLWSECGHSPAEAKKKYAAAFVLAEQQKEARYFQIASAINRLQDGGLLVVCAKNDQGGRSLSELENVFHITTHGFSKNKCRVIWGTKTQDPQIISACTNALKLGGRQQRGDGLWTQPGVFSWEHSDTASLMLTNHLPQMKGDVADFGCGIGEISFRICNKARGITSVTLIDHDIRAIECAKKNIPLSDEYNTEYIWSDIREIHIQNRFDAILMNPPFHTGKTQTIDIGMAFIKKAYDALKKNSTLYMVANTHLPYEKLISGLFASYAVLANEKGFKVISAKK